MGDLNTPREKRRTRGPAADTRARLLAGTLQCLRESGVEGTTIAAVARASGLSRPTIYAHFNTLGDLIHQTVEDAAVALSARLGREIAAHAHHADLIVEFVVAAHREFKADPVVALVMDLSVDRSLAHHSTISPVMVRLSQESLRRVLRDDPEALARIDDIVETMLRFLLSVLAYSSENTSSDERLRAYLGRTMVPALGLGRGERD